MKYDSEIKLLRKSLHECDLLVQTLVSMPYGIIREISGSSNTDHIDKLITHMFMLSRSINMTLELYNKWNEEKDIN